MRFTLKCLVLFAVISTGSGAVPTAAFFKAHCTECHDADTKKGGLDLGSASQTSFSAKVDNGGSDGGNGGKIFNGGSGGDGDEGDDEPGVLRHAAVVRRALRRIR